MIPDAHERACRLIDARYVEEISTSEREWLETHMAECLECQARDRANQLAFQMVRSDTVTINPELVSITQARVRSRAHELHEYQARMRALWISCALSWLLGAVTAPLLWEAIAWAGRRLEISQVVWIAAFAVCWVAPATLVGAVVAWRCSRASGVENGS